VHEVTPVTRGERLASFFWIESMVRSGEQRRLLFEMDQALIRLRAAHGESREAIELTGTYHNLLRMWADT
jgi:PKHD-type hydroxylase